MMGTSAEDVVCKENMALMKRSSGTAACVTSSTAMKLEKAGWGMMLKDVGMMDLHREKMMDKHSEKMMKDKDMMEQKETSLEISAEFPFESKYVEVLGSQMHYIDEGEGDPVLFLHGNPTSSYLWRNVIPYVSDDTRVIAVDLIGMGKSDKPDIDYSFDDHSRYLNAFIEELELKNITLVIHDWGSGLGFNYAANNEDNIKGIAFMEALLMPLTWDDFTTDEMKEMFQNFRTPGIGEEMIMNQNIFVEQLLPSMIVRELSEEEMNYYQEPYPTPESRKPVWKWPNEIPIDGEPKNTHDIISSYNQWLQTTEIPMLMIYATPGVIGNEMAVQWAEDNLMNLETVHIGPGLHFIQEDSPDAIGEAISDWYQRMSKSMDDSMDEQTISSSILKYTQEAPMIDPEKGYFVEEIADGIYWLIGSGYQVMFLTTGEGVIVIDAPQPIGEKYLQAVQEVTDEPITHMIYSHSHADHTGAAGQIFPIDIEYIAHQDTADILISENDPNRPVPTVTFNDMYTLSVGNQVLELSYIGPFHSEGDLVILAPKQKVAMVVDLFHPGAAPYRAFGVTVNLDTHIQAHDTLVEDFDFDVLVSGHEQILATKDHIKTDKEFILSMKDIIQQAIQTVASDETIQTCVDNTIEKWQGKLDNLEQFMVEHCTAMLEYVSPQ